MSTEPEQLPEGPFTILELNGQLYTISNQDGHCVVSSTPTPTPTPTPAPPTR